MRSFKLCLMVLYVAVLCNAPLFASDITPKMRMEDPRLEKRITVVGKGTYLAELLSTITREGDVEVVIDERDELSGTRVSLSVNSVPLSDVLNAIWSLVSNRESRWAWIRKGEPGKYRYVLFPSADAKEKNRALQQYAQMAFDNYMGTMLSMARMMPQERKKNQKNLAATLFEDKEYWAKAFVDAPEIWDGVLLFAETVPPNLQQKVMRGERDFRIAVKQASPEVQERLHRIWATWYPVVQQSDGSADAAPPEPDELHFYSHSGDKSSPDMLCTLYLGLDKMGGGMSLISEYAIEKGLRSVIRKLWIMLGETDDSLLADKEVTEAHSLQPPQIPVREGEVSRPLTRYSNALVNRLFEIADGTSTPILALLPYKQRDPGSPVKQKIRGFLEKFEFQPILPIYKWRGDFLLVNYPRWFVEENRSIPYELIRACLFSKNGVITLLNLAKLMSRINDAQVEELASSSQSIRSALIMRPLFALYQKYPEVILPNGLALNAEHLAYIRSIPLYASDTLIQQNAITHLRLHSFEVTEPYGKGLVIRPEVMLNGKWVSLGGFIQIPKVDKAAH